MTMKQLRRDLLTLISSFVVVLILISGNPDVSLACFSDLDGGHDVAVVEHLRIQVPSRKREAWMDAERGSWQPWLARQEGFVGRDLLWDPETEEGTILVGWSSRKAWKAIPQLEVEAVQERFEQLARKSTGQKKGNPFPLVFEGELLPP
ncbi:hypothetical protein MITS9509_01446 [Synechococcus sp. MIT S9509]|nr:hypothetical protein MITS9504_01206 [Synechococcus sp. MIT S9504]KZR92455.1 hypothetical protein MITS9509_01446 [Synechococcus sp. MIT S9509]